MTAFAALIASTVLTYVAAARLFGPPKDGPYGRAKDGPDVREEIARRGEAVYGGVAAVFFVLTPLVWHQVRNEPASVHPLAFVTAWLAAVAYVDRVAPMWAVAGATLGLGMYTSFAAIVMMPLYLLLTVAVFVHARRISIRETTLLTAAFALAAAPLAFTLVRHPETFRNTVNAYHLYDANRFNILQGIREMTSWVGLTARSEVYFDYFNPVFLFLNGGVLFMPLVVLVPAGLYRILSIESRPLARLVLAGFIAAPFAASLTAQPPTPRRILFVAPFAAMVAAYGIQQLAASLKRPSSAVESPPPARLPHRESL